MSFDDCNADITSVKEGGRVVGIAFRIQGIFDLLGKSDKHPVTLMCWNDDIFPEFCPVRHLLAYLAISGIKQGYFFPCKKVLCQAGQEGDVKKAEQIAYVTYLDRFKNICKKLNFSGTWGCHTGRKTAYLFAVWGGGSDTDIMQRARHKTVKNSIKYKNDASFLLALCEINGIVVNASTPTFRSLYCHNHQMAISINANNSPNYQGLAKLREILLTTHLNLPNFLSDSELDEIKIF